MSEWFERLCGVHGQNPVRDGTCICSELGASDTRATRATDAEWFAAIREQDACDALPSEIIYNLEYPDDSVAPCDANDGCAPLRALLKRAMEGK